MPIEISSSTKPYIMEAMEVYAREFQKHKLRESYNDTINCWIATRINGASASLACDGNIGVELLRELDEKIKRVFK